MQEVPALPGSGDGNVSRWDGRNGCFFFFFCLKMVSVAPVDVHCSREYDDYKGSPFLTLDDKERT